MNTKSGHIYPIADQLLNQADKEALLSQRGKVVWLTGLSGSGKSTIAKGAERTLHEKGFLVAVLDGDDVRLGLCDNLGFSEGDRKENLRRTAEAAKLLLNCGVVVICSFVSPTEEVRKLVSDIIGTQHFFQVYVNTPLEECEKRDVKGLYAKARNGELPEFTGISAPFEAPANPTLEIKTRDKTVEESVNELITFLLPEIKMSN